jgi:hypothetical protein
MELRTKTGIVDVGARTAKLKWDWTGHVCQMHAERWANLATEWLPQDGFRGRGRPKTRWRDDLDDHDRGEWWKKGEAFAQQ